MYRPARRIRASVCANQTAADVAACVEGGADAVGVLVQVKHRAEDAIDLDHAANLMDMVPPYVGRYAVTHATEIREICDLRNLAIDTIQLHEDIDPAIIPEIRRGFPRVRLLKAIHVVDEGSISMAERWQGLVEGLVLDSVNKIENRIGGTGLTHDWSISARIIKATKVPVVLAGGLRPENVCEAVRAVLPWGVNVNSGVERGEVKMRDLVEGFVRGANAACD
ncbi:phosphoribosylanthranilate isomerase [Frankia sp. CcI49]|uniref:phosphoribosylanthranilate isomerase n=1 Tax=Frankia sp. CcI49 TaxID=1745382 RepID=UPI000977E008|nr:phosphoribosylanthranilate isomerase [Frankia sp. CcI49]